MRTCRVRVLLVRTEPRSGGCLDALNPRHSLRMARRSDPQTTVLEAERVLTEIALREPQRDFGRRPLKLPCVRVR